MYASSAGIQNQIHAANVAITIAAITEFPERMPASTVNHGAAPIVPSVEPPATPFSEFQAIAP